MGTKAKGPWPPSGWKAHLWISRRLLHWEPSVQDLRCHNQKGKFILHSIYRKLLRILEEGYKG